MGSRHDPGRIFTLDFPPSRNIGLRLASLLRHPLERLLWLEGVNRIYKRCSKQTDPLRFVDACLEDLKVRCDVSDRDLRRIPATGPFVLVANHPFGAIEGLMMAQLIGRVRPDFKLMANYLLGKIPQLRELFILVNPFGTRDATRENLGAMRECHRLLQSGHALGVFPGGEVSHWSHRERRVCDPAWNETIARIVRKTGVPVLPVYFSGQNSAVFQILGMMHPRLRTAMLPRELQKKREHTIRTEVGAMIPHEKLAAFPTDAAMTDYMRQRVYFLQNRRRERRRPTLANVVTQVVQPMVPIVPATPTPALLADIAGIPADHVLVESRDYLVIKTSSGYIPNILREIGRLREITFRKAGEGTRKSIDLDHYDRYYEHLFVWHRHAAEVVGAYRVGFTDRIVDNYGKTGLYTHSLFDFSDSFVPRITPALELGRSFIREEYQRNYQPLALLWRGIGQIVRREPRYKTLFGPVSISGSYKGVSRTMMVAFLRANNAYPQLSSMVRPRNPFHASGRPDEVKAICGNAGSLEELGELIADIEHDRKGIPVLLRQYLKLGGKLIEFNVDRQFCEAIDALLVVDLTQADRRTLERYMGKAEAAEFLHWHTANKC